MPVVHQWIPAFAGITSGMEFSGFPVLQVYPNGALFKFWHYHHASANQAEHDTKQCVYFRLKP